jgi:predicted small integral membrane protein
VPEGLALPTARAVAVSARASRLDWLDLYRGLAVLVMIETHVANTFLTAELKATEWFTTLTYFNGLVAPAFLFIAGYAQGLGLRKAQARKAGVRRRLRRLAEIAALGYLLHLPIAQASAGDWAEMWRVGSGVDILTCLAVSIGLLVMAERLAGKWTPAVVGALTALVILAAPQFAEWTGAPAVVLAFLNHTTGSLFPLLPWAAFGFAGFLVSSVRPAWQSVIGPVLGCAGAVFLLGRLHLTPASPAFFFERLGWILCLVPVCAWLAPRVAPAGVLFAGRESLVMYVAHLVLIALCSGAGLSALGLGAMLPLLAATLAATFATTFLWRRATVWLADRARRAMHPRGSLAPAG